MLVLLAGLRRRVDDDPSVEAIHDDTVRRPDPLGEAGQTGHGRDLERAGDGTDVLTAGASEADEHARARVHAAADRDLLNRLRHARVRDLDEACRELVEATIEALAPKLVLARGQLGRDNVAIERERKAIGL